MGIPTIAQALGPDPADTRGHCDGAITWCGASGMASRRLRVGAESEYKRETPAFPININEFFTLSVTRTLTITSHLVTDLMFCFNLQDTWNSMCVAQPTLTIRLQLNPDFDRGFSRSKSLIIMNIRMYKRFGASKSSIEIGVELQSYR